MQTIRAKFADTDTCLGLLGRVGENGTRQIEFDCAEILEEYPAAVIVCAVKRPGEESAYPVRLQAEETVRRLILSSEETAKQGTLRIELRAENAADDAVRVSATYTGAILRSLSGESEETTE